MYFGMGRTRGASLLADTSLVGWCMSKVGVSRERINPTIAHLLGGASPPSPPFCSLARSPLGDGSSGRRQRFVLGTRTYSGAEVFCGTARADLQTAAWEAAISIRLVLFPPGLHKEGEIKAERPKERGRASARGGC